MARQIKIVIADRSEFFKLHTNSDMKNIFAIFCFLAMLLVAAALFFRGERVREAFDVKPERHLEAAIPSKLGVLVSKDLPLGQTEEVLRASERILDLNEFLNREYSYPDGRSFNLYISYWSPGKQDVTNASSHTPDRCWVKAGWKNDDAKKVNNYVIETGAPPLMPAYSREYTIDASDFVHRRYVWFWHIVDGERYDFRAEDNYVINPLLFITNSVHDALMGSPEQYFIRLDSALPLESFLNDESFRSLLDSLGELILAKKKEAADDENAKQ